MAISYSRPNGIPPVGQFTDWRKTSKNYYFWPKLPKTVIFGEISWFCHKKYFVKSWGVFLRCDQCIRALFLSYQNQNGSFKNKNHQTNSLMLIYFLQIMDVKEKKKITNLHCITIALLFQQFFLYFILTNFKHLGTFFNERPGRVILILIQSFKHDVSSGFLIQLQFCTKNALFLIFGHF